MEDTIKQADVWAEYKDHVKRRNTGVVHNSVDVNHTQAAASLAAARAMIEQVQARRRAFSP